MTLIAKINPQPGGKVTLEDPAGVRSCQPDGSLQYRPTGANGPYEVCTLNGLTATYQPLTNGPTFLFALV